MRAIITLKLHYMYILEYDIYARLYRIECLLSSHSCRGLAILFRIFSLQSKHESFSSCVNCLKSFSLLMQIKIIHREGHYKHYSEDWHVPLILPLKDS